MIVKFIIPCYNAKQNQQKLLNSLFKQDNKCWEAIFVDDVSDAGLELAECSDARVSIVRNSEKKYALKNIVETVKEKCDADDIVALIDGDDQLCNDKTVTMLYQAYKNNKLGVAWTSHKWDINNLNVSKELPQGVNPYQFNWVTSHLKTFRAGLLNHISEVNFKNYRGEWFQRGYDQALMLPLLYIAKEHMYIPEVCYLYNINSVSVNDRDWAEQKQLSTVNFVRSRGFIADEDII